MKHDTESYIITIRRRNGYRQADNMTHTSLTGRTVIQPMSSASTSDEASEPSAAKTFEIKAPLPGVMIAVNVKIGDVVKAGQEIAVLEAMKMENSIEAVMDGTVTAVHVKEGDSVLEGDTVITIG
jgi:biotin carboxyl carrier protein